jgi:DNA primase
VLSHQAGYTNAVAVSGTALTQHHVMLLQRLSNRVVLALDADRAGIAAVKRAADIMLPRGMDIKVANMIGGKDPADMVKDDVQKLRKIIGSAQPVVEYLLDILESEKKDDRSFKLRVREEVLPLVVKISNKIDQDHFEGVIAERLSTSKDAIHFEIERIIETQSQKRTAPQTQTHQTIPEPADGKELPHRAEELEHFLSVLSTMIDTALQKKLARAFAEVTGKDIAHVYGNLSAEHASPISFMLETHVSSVPKKQLAEEICDKLHELSRHRAKQMLSDLKDELRAAEASGDEALVASCLSRMGEVQKELLSRMYTVESFM